MQNIKQTISIPFYRIIAYEFDPTDLEYFERSYVNPNKPAILKLMENYQITNLTDELQVTVSVGSILFDILMAANPAPQAPLLKYKHNQELISLSENLLKDNFDLTVEQKEQIKLYLETEEIWNTLIINVTINNKFNLEFSSAFIYSFSEIVTEIIKEFT